MHYDEATLKKILFPVQRVAANVAALHLPHFSPHFFLVGKYHPFFGEKQIVAKMRKKSP